MRTIRSERAAGARPLRAASPVPALLTLAFAACGREHAELDVFAAASLREVCEELAPEFEAQHPGLRLVFNFGASNLLAEQIGASTRGGVFLSADGLQLDRIELTGRMAEGTRRTFLANALVVIVPADATGDGVPARAVDLVLERFERLSLAHPEAVPAGRYAREWLTALGLWNDVQHKVVPGVDVRAALAAVESGAADAGIVYATDAAITPGVRVAFRVEGEGAPEIRYHAAAIKPGSLAQRKHDGALRTAAFELLEFLGSERAGQVFTAHGFLPLAGAF
jgi:molybdate transport system substrate-binding protein